MYIFGWTVLLSVYYALPFADMKKEKVKKMSPVTRWFSMRKRRSSEDWSSWRFCVRVCPRTVFLPQFEVRSENINRSHSLQNMVFLWNAIIMHFHTLHFTYVCTCFFTSVCCLWVWFLSFVSKRFCTWIFWLMSLSQCFIRELDSVERKILLIHIGSMLKLDSLRSDLNYIQIRRDLTFYYKCFCKWKTIVFLALLKCIVLMVFLCCTSPVWAAGGRLWPSSPFAIVISQQTWVMRIFVFFFFFNKCRI